MAWVKLRDVMKRAQTKVDKDNTDLIYYVGGEHIESEQIQVKKRGVIAGSKIGPMFYYGFKAGDFLLVSRNPHLKKAGIVSFSGICSEKTFVLESSDQKVLAPKFLPFILQNDKFWDYAYQHRHGSTNTFINWSTLANYEFELPPLDVQLKLADVLWAIYDTKDKYKKLISATDELVKSQFIEMFKKCNREKLGDYILQVRGVSYKPKDLSEGFKEGFVKLLRANNIANNVLNFEDVQFVSEGRVSDDQIIREGDILICASSGSLEHVGKAALCIPDMEYTFGAFCKLIRPIGKLYPEYIAGYMRTDEYRNTISDLAQGSNINNLRNEHINDLMIPIPSDEQQVDFIDLQRQSDKSKLSSIGYMF